MRGPCPCPLAGIDLIAAFYGCLYAGCVPVTVRPPHPQNIATTLPTVKMIVEVTLPRGSEPASREGRVRDCRVHSSAPGTSPAPAQEVQPGGLHVWTEGCRASWP